MFLDNNFGKTLELHHRMMDTTLYRHSVITNNLANAQTPDYKRSMVNFESMLKYALSTESEPRFKTAVSDSRHISFYKKMDYREVRPRRVLDYTRTSKNNGNNVDLDEESALALNNTLRYNLLTYVTNQQFSRMQTVLSG